MMEGLGVLSSVRFLKDIESSIDYRVETRVGTAVNTVLRVQHCQD